MSKELHLTKWGRVCIIKLKRGKALSAPVDLLEK